MSFLVLDDVVTWKASRFELVSGSEMFYKTLGSHPRKHDPSLSLRGEPRTISSEELAERRARAEASKD